MSAQHLFDEVAKEAFLFVREKVAELESDPEYDCDTECEFYLFVYPDGKWTIDHAQYLPDHNWVACTWIADYDSWQELSAYLEEGMTDDDYILPSWVGEVVPQQAG